MNISVFVSGRGSNLQAIIQSAELKQKVEVVLVVSDKINCPAFEIANSNLVETITYGENRGGVSSEDLIQKLIEKKTDLIVLAGYLRKIPLQIIEIFKNRIINIHPALLPSFGGKGMYGINVHKAVFDSSCKVSGATVHFVDETYDTGKIIAQRCVDISNVKSPEEIAARVLKVEHQLLPEVIKMFNENRIRFENGIVQITN